MEGDSIEHDMGELVPSPVVLKAAIVGLEESDHVFELIEYPYVERSSPNDDDRRPSITDMGITHVGLLCDDAEKTRAELESRGVRFITSSSAKVAGLRTSWFEDPWGTVFILVEKRHPSRPYWRQFA